MTTELTVLALSGLLICVQLAIYSVLANLQVGVRYSLGSRDAPLNLTGMAGRAQRALNNQTEGIVLFTVAVVVLTLADKSSGLTGNLAWAYLFARILYVPAYLFGLSPWRSIIWFVGWLSTLAMLIIAAI
jgi:uncharacterized MAPEG superfamily protein